METLKQVLMYRDGMSEEAAEDLIQEAREDLYDRLAEEGTIDDAEFMSEWFGLEPDYFIELLN